MRKVAGRLRLDLAQFRELEAFAAFGSDLDAASKAQLERGTRLVELLKQAQYRPYSMEREVVSVWSGTTGQLDDVPVEDIRRFDAEFLDYIARERPDLIATIAETGDLSDDVTAGLTSAVVEFKRQFRTTEGHLLGTEAEVAALDEAEIEHAQITRVVRKG
jgi:F-type H+-transporting ATPase subunit alpha